MDLNFRKRRIYSILWLMVVVMMMIRCLPEPLDIDELPKLEPKIVVSSQIIPGNGLVIFLSKSIGALDAGNDSDPEDLLQQIAIDDAQVILTGGEQSDTLQNLANGLYGGINTNWQEGRSYTLLITSPTMGSVKATTQVLSTVRFDRISARVISNEFDSLAQINYQFTDPSEKNFYMINVQRIRASQQLDRLINPRIYTRLLDDSEFKGQLKEETFNVLFQEYSIGDTIAVSMANISEYYYKFLKLRNDNRFSFVEFAGEPINYPSNVKDGYGFFNLHTPDYRLFILE